MKRKLYDALVWVGSLAVLGLISVAEWLRYFRRPKWSNGKDRT